MALYKEYTTAKYQWGIWKVTETQKELLSLLPDNGVVYLNELDTFKSESRKIEWLAVRVLLYRLTGKIKAISYLPNGKPYYANGSGYLSISHTKGYVSVIISKTNEVVGVDIERVSERIRKVAHKFVRDDEALPEESAQKTQALLLIWSAKETMFKCVNEEGVDFREHMHVDLRQINGTGFLGKETRSSEGRMFLMNYLIDPDFVMTWTVS